MLQDLERRRHVEEQARWDFMALDTMGSGCLSLSQALLLMQTIHGALFSLSTWNSFLASRQAGGEAGMAILCCASFELTHVTKYPNLKSPNVSSQYL